MLVGRSSKKRKYLVILGFPSRRDAAIPYQPINDRVGRYDLCWVSKKKSSVDSGPCSLYYGIEKATQNAVVLVWYLLNLDLGSPSEKMHAHPRSHFS